MYTNSKAKIKNYFIVVIMLFLSIGTAHSAETASPQRVLQPVFFPKGDQLKIKSNENYKSLIISNKNGISTLTYLKAHVGTIDPKQFYAFQMNKDGTISLPHEVTPSIDGSGDEKDVRMEISLDSFHVNKNIKIGKKDLATLRLRVGNDDDADTNFANKVFWYVTAGLKLYDDTKNKKTDYKDTQTKLTSQFRTNPIVIPGGLGRIKIDIVKHQEKPWYKSALSFLTGTGGKALTSVVGFPGITDSAVQLIDSLLSELLKEKPKVLFGGDYVRYAFTKSAKEEIENGGGNTLAGCLNKGRWLLVKGIDAKKLLHSKTVYDWTYGVLYPSKMNVEDLITGKEKNPLDEITWAVLRVRMKSVKWDDFLNVK